MKSAPPGMLKDLDMSVFEAWVSARSSFLDAKAWVDKLGLVIKNTDGSGTRDNPFMYVMNRQRTDMVKYAAELGFTPSSRSRVKIVPEKPGSSSTFAGLKSLTDD